MEKVRKLVMSISPRAKFTGKKQFTLAIFYYREAASMEENRRVYVTKEVYPQVAKGSGSNCVAASRAVCRAVEYCWMEGRNEALNRIIGRPLPEKPKPEELLCYCAYYLEKGRPYFQR